MTATDEMPHAETGDTEIHHQSGGPDLGDGDAGKCHRRDVTRCSGMADARVEEGENEDGGVEKKLANGGVMGTSIVHRPL